MVVVCSVCAVCAVAAKKYVQGEKPMGGRGRESSFLSFGFLGNRGTPRSFSRGGRTDVPDRTVDLKYFLFRRLEIQ